MKEAKLLSYIAELEARVISFQHYMNSLVELNNLKLPEEDDLEKDARLQNIVAEMKYKDIL